MTIHQDLMAAGVELDHHESDLYARDTPEAAAIVRAYEHNAICRLFRASDGSGLWWDIPFAFDPFWESGQ